MKSYFLTGDGVERKFDAGFFGVKPVEANVMDPQVRILLEATYEALENAGQTIESLQGSDTGCYVGLMLGEYEQAMMRDPESIGTYHLTGTSRGLMSNRLSYFFDWHGPSMTIDTACSSSLIAVHQAVQLLRTGQSRVAIAAGSNLLLDTNIYVSESNLQMLSPDGQSRMWSADANGYARGEGVATIIMKRLSDAVADGDDVLCVIRESGTNQDGKTPGLTISTAQEALIRDTYRRAGLNPKNPADQPQFFEAHGTGTPAGDPIEAAAIHAAFFGGGDPADVSNTMLVGSIKTICGHTEGTAGVAGILKAALSLQHSTVLPNLLFKSLNPKLKPFAGQLRVPTTALPWPAVEDGQPRRASVNSFGFGGSNAHVILESYTPSDGDAALVNGAADVPVFTPFVFSAASEKSLKNYIESFTAHLEAHQDTFDSAESLRHLAYTLHARRSRFQYATAVAASSVTELVGKLREKLQSQSPEKPVGLRANRDLDHRKPVVIGVFTGQGAQWACMGADLLAHSSVADGIFSKLEARLARLPVEDRPSWSLKEELRRSGPTSRVAEAELSQPLCTAVQIVLVDLVRAAGIEFGAVVGHSSGEIAAAYAAGLISADDAICVAYYRGFHGKLAGATNGQPGAMLAAGTSAEDAAEIVEAFEGRAKIACYNSSSSVTLSGDEDALQEIKVVLDDESKFARMLKVEKAYHSHHMLPCAEAYRNSVKALNISVAQPNSKCTWISSVSGQDISTGGQLDRLRDGYWVDNLTSPVLFMQALKRACEAHGGAYDMAVEVGPHPALQGPALQTIKEATGQAIPYTGLLKRGAADLTSLADGLGQAWVHLGRGSSLNLQEFDQFVSSGAPSKLVKGLPTYAWDHDADYWHDSRYAKAYFSRSKNHELLGHLAPDCNPDQELRWRQILIPKEFPWINGHKLQNQMIFPGAGYVSLAIESCRELLKMSSETATLIEVHDVDIVNALTFDGDDSKVETIFRLSEISRNEGTGKDSRGTITARWQFSAAHFGSVNRQGDANLRTLSRGLVKITLGRESATALPARGPRPDNCLPLNADDFYDSLRQMEYEYSGPFPALTGLQRKLGTVTGYVENMEDPDSELLVHPGMLDAVFQSVLLAHSAPYDGSLWSMHVPRTIDRVIVNPLLCEIDKIRGKMLPLDSFQVPTVNTIKGDMDVFPPEVELPGAALTNAMIQVEGLDCVPFSQAMAHDDKQVFSVVEWNSAVPDAAGAAWDMDPTTEQKELAHFLERLSFYYLQNLQRSIPEDDPCRSPDAPLSGMFGMVKHIESLIATGQRPFWKADWNNDTQETISAASQPYLEFIDFKMVREIGENLVEIVRGNKSAIEVAMKDNLLNELYPNALGMKECTVYLARLIKQMTHRYPHLNVLEIGAGTGGSTKAIMGAVGESFSSYTYTDISSGFFPAAQEVFREQASRMTYKVLDISRSPAEQGFAEGQQYELLVASMALHATPSIRQTLANARRLLKPGGYLVAMEGFSNDVARTGLVFGAFAGWWLGAGEGRVLGPHATVAEWDGLLRETGFSGCDSLTPVVDPLFCHTTVFVSQAVDARVNYLRDPLASVTAPESDLKLDRASDLIVVGGRTPASSTCVSELMPMLQQSFGNITPVQTLSEVASLNLLPTTTILSLSDLDEPLFEKLAERDFESAKKVLESAGSVLWVTQGRRAENPTANMTVGMVRTVLLEVPTLAFQFFDFEDARTLSADKIAEALLRFKAGVAWQQEDSTLAKSGDMLTTVEREIVLDERGRMLIPRALPNKNMNDRYNSSRRAIYNDVALSNDGNVSLVRDEGRHEYYLEQSDERTASEDLLRISHSLLPTLRVEGLGYAHLSLAKDKSSGISHVVLSSHVTSAIEPIEGVPAVGLSEAKMLSLQAAHSSAQFLRLVALNMLAIDLVAGLSQGEQLVVYEPEPALAQVLQREAKGRGVGVTVLTSAMSSDRCQLLGWVPVHAQVPARILKDTLPKGASVFLNCEDGHVEDGVGMASRIVAHLSSRCKIVSFADLFDKTAWIKLANSPSTGADVHSRLVSAVKRAEGDKVSTSTVDINTIPVNQIAEAIPADVKLDEKTERATVVEWNQLVAVPIKVRPVDDHQLFVDSKTYWLAGLSGNVGLSLAEWMIGHGARHIVITSRNPKVSASWLDRMAARGAVVKVLANNLTDLKQTQSLYHDICSVMPPIGGVAQGAMVLEDTAFRNMTREAMEKVLQPKVQGSIVLDALFRDNKDLDFFVFFSSLVGVLGNAGQANYSAANLFMASLAGQRRRRGLAASVMHIGPVLGVGYVSQNSQASKAIFSRASGLQFVSERDLHQHFAEAVVAGRPGHSGPLEIATGLLRVPASPEKKPFWFSNPMTTHFIMNNTGGAADSSSKASESKASVKALLLQAKTPGQVTDVLRNAFRQIICALFHLGATDLDDETKFMNSSLDEMGLDSLLAVEIRTWWMKTVQVNISVMKILSGLTIGELVALAQENLSADLTPLMKSDGEVEEDKTVPQVKVSSASSAESADVSSKGSSTSASSEAGDPAIMTPFSEPEAFETTAKDTEIVCSSPLPTVTKWMDLSFSQQVFWFVLTFLEDRAGLNHTGAFRLTGPLRVADLEQAIMRLGQRHESLRTCFKTDENGQPKQGVYEPSQLRLERRRVTDETEASKVAEDLQAYCYDLESGECFRAILLELSPTVNFVVYGTHSLVLDGLSSVVLTRELQHLYDNDTSSLTPAGAICQYPAFAQAQLEALKNGGLEPSLRFWRNEFSTCPAPLPVLRVSPAVSRPVQKRYENQRADLRVDAATKAAIWRVCRAHRIRPFHFFLAAFRALLARWADAEEVSVGIGDASRSHDGAMGSLGPYINLLPLRFSNDAAQVFGEVLEETKGKTDSALAHSDVPFQVLLNDLGVPRSASHTPIFQTFFDYRQGMRKKQPWGNCELEMLSFQASKVPYDLALDIIDDAGDADCLLMLIVREDMYSKQDAEVLLRSYGQLVKAFAESPEVSFAEPDMFEKAEVEKSLTFGRGEFLPSKWAEKTVIERVQAIAQSKPDNIAVKLPHGGKSMTYSQMMAKSHAIATALQAEGCTRGSVIAVYQEPSPDWLASVLAIFSIGAICVPFDAGTPTKRLLDMARDSQVSIVIVDAELEATAASELLVDGGAKGTISVDQCDAVQTLRAAMPAPLAAPEDPAMILYTSGSTGNPKGIVLKHSGFRNWAEFVPARFSHSPGGAETVLQQSSSSFDMAFLQVFWALCFGGTVALVPRGDRVDAGAITDIIATEGVTVTNGVPSEYSNWLRYGNKESLLRSASHWKTAMCGGEPGTPAIMDLYVSLGEQGPRPRFYHMYGPTEITFITSGTELTYPGPGARAEKSASVGGPFPNYSIYILDEQLRPVPPGVQGEIYIGGAGVASGYLGNPTLTAEKFMPDNLAPEAIKTQGWCTMHRTGDIGRWTEAGGVMIEGRKSGDTQHKLRGLRVDLQEVENVMLKEARGILSDVVVTVRRTSPQSPEFLVAHVRFEPEHCPPEEEQQSVLSSLLLNLPLPQYMWPAAAIAVKELPMMVSGKLNRRAVAALPLPDISALEDHLDGEDSSAPPPVFTDTESKMKKIWEDLISQHVIKMRRIRPETDFFHVGGTSLLLLQLQAQIKQTFGFRIPLVQLFESSTLAAMARRVDNKSEAENEMTFDWEVETAVPEATATALKTAVDRIPAANRSVVLTGATGLLGQGFLKALVADASINMIHCIGVRNAAARISSLPLLAHAKVTCHEGDLAAPQLGLDDATATSIFGSADRIIHNGADTSHFKTYRSLRGSNLQATKEITRLALRFGGGCKIPIHFVSTASVLQYSGLESFGEESAAAYPPPPNALDGYSATKWASERYLERLYELSGGSWPIWIHRPTSVQRPGGDYEGSNNDGPSLDLISNLLRYCKAANCVPASPNLLGVLNLVPLERIVESMLHEMSVAAAPGSGVRFVNEVGETDIPLDNIKDYVDAQTGASAGVLPLDQWAKRAGEAGMDAILVAFFENMVGMPPVVWQKLSRSA
ncbi:putative Hybrid PKS-NRPS biosynthetic cluster [Diaporthe eres]